MHYKYSNELTEREKAYLAYFTRRGLVSDELWLACKSISIFCIVLACLFAAMSTSKEGWGIKDILIGAFPFAVFLAVLWGGILSKIKEDKERMEPIYNGNYSMIRTKIENKGMVDYGFKTARSYRTIWFSAYYCEGISEPVAPPTEKLYKLSKEGDDITVLIVESENIYLGITFNDKYEEKVFNYYNTKKKYPPNKSI